jgi:Protein of unknown function (DUF3060)
MDPEDDPEKRIRELEQPLADVARTSEPGGAQPSGGYAYPSGPAGYPSGPWGPPAPPPPPPLTYGGPFPGTPPRSSSGIRVWWILAAVFVIGTLALVGGIAAFAAHQFSRGGGLVIPSPTPSTSRSTTSPRSTPRSPTPSAGGTQTPSAGPSTSPTPPPGGSLSVSGINENRTIACNDSIVSVSGVSNTVVITGHCASLTVSGLKNSVTVDAADTIEASGFNNQITYHSGSPKISKAGDGNVVQQG